VSETAMTVKRIIVIGMGTFFQSACTSDERTNDGTRNPCIPADVAVRAIPDDSVSAADRCRLFILAIGAVGTADSTSGIVPSDTGRITEVLFVPLAHPSPVAGPQRATWHVSLTLADQPYDAEIVIDRKTGQTAVSRVHKADF
jgi:hypothetical protein